MRAGSWILIIAVTVTVAAVGAAPRDAAAQARPRPVQKGKAPIQPGEKPPPQADAPTAPAPEPADLEKIRGEARAKLDAAAEAGDPAAAAAAVKTLLPFVKLDEQVDAQVRAALVHIEADELARAEKLLGEARGGAKDQPFVGRAYEAVRNGRNREEKAALAEITTAEDPRAPARVLARGLTIEPDGPRAAQASAQLTAKVDRMNAKMSDAEVAQAIEALAILENARGDTVARLTKASNAVAEGALSDAEDMFADIRVSATGPEASAVAERAAGWVRARRIRELEAGLDEAQKNGDVLAESSIIQALLTLDPKHREANRRSRDIERRVLAARMKMVAEARDNGELGVAHWYATRGLAVDANHAGLNAAKKELEAELKARADLIMVVEAPITEGTTCGPIGPVLQQEAMEITSRREDLGGYVLSAGWTDAWQNGDERAPAVTGSLAFTVTRCAVTPASGSAAVEWAVTAPQGPDGSVVAEGTEDVKIAATAIPKEEQDAEAKNARRALADEIATVVAERISEARDDVQGWLLVVAGHHMQRDEPAAVADAWARFNLDRPVLYDEDLASRIQTYLAQQYR